MQCSLRAGVIGVSYKTADLHLREAMARAAEKISGERAVFFKHPIVAISTCSRTEIYFSGEDLSEAQSDLLAVFRAQLKEPFEHRVYSYFGIDCFVHLCRVTAGLDSAILAETEIQRQVKLAYCQSSQIIHLPSCLHYMFQKGLRVGKLARNNLSLEKGASTLYGTVFQLAESNLGNLEARCVLLVGYSEINRGLISYLQKKGLKKIVLATRYPAAAQIEGVAVHSREVLACWQEFDWVVCSARSDEYLLTGEGRGNNLIFDFSVPRNVDPAIRGARLLNIEEINQMVEQNRRARADCLAACEDLVLCSVRNLAKSYRAKVSRRFEKII